MKVNWWLPIEAFWIVRSTTVLLLLSGTTTGPVKLLVMPGSDAGVTLRLMRAMDAQGDRVGALECARRHVDRIHRDLEAEPDRAVVALASELQSRELFAPGVAALEPKVALGERSASPPGSNGSVSARGSRFPGLQWFGLAAIITLAVATTLAARHTRPPAGHGFIRLAIFPFVVVGDSQYRYLGEGMARLLSTGLDGGGDLVTVSPTAVISAVRDAGPVPDVDRLRGIADRLEADQFVVGTAVGKGDRLRLTAVLHPAAGHSAPQRELTVEGPIDELAGLVDSLTSGLLVAEARPANRLIRIAAATTHSIPALKEYLNGDRLFQQGRYAAAAGAFDRATRLDPAFALAHSRCPLATLGAYVPATAPRDHDAQASRYADQLAPRDRELVLAYLAWRRGDADEADRRYRALWTRYPDDVEAGFQLAETVFHYGPLMGRPLDEAHGILREVLRIDSTHRGARWHLALLDGLDGNGAELSARLEDLEHSSAPDVEVRGLSLRLRGNHLDQDSVIQRALPGQLWALAWRLAINAQDLAGADEALRLVPATDPGAQPLVLHSQALLRLARGQWRNGVAALRAADAIALGVEALTIDGPVVNRIFSPPPDEIARAREVARTALAQVDSTVSGTTEQRVKLVVAIGRLSLALHDSAGAVTARETAARLGDMKAAHSLDAFLAARAGRVDQALRYLDLARRTPWFGLAAIDPYYGQQAERFLRAELLLARGRYHEALRWYGTFGSFALDDLPYLARAEQRRAEIFERLGWESAAIKSVSHAAALWTEVDPEIGPYPADAARMLARLKRAR